MVKRIDTDTEDQQPKIRARGRGPIPKKKTSRTKKKSTTKNASTSPRGIVNIKKFGLYHTNINKILGYRTEQNVGDGVEIQYILDANSDCMWLIDTPEQAEYARIINTPWYVANYDTPSNPYYDINDLIVVEIEIVARKIEIQLPTIEEFLSDKFDDSEENKHIAIKKFLNKEIDAHVLCNKSDYLKFKESKRGILFDDNKS